MVTLKFFTTDFSNAVEFDEEGSYCYYHDVIIISEQRCKHKNEAM